VTTEVLFYHETHNKNASWTNIVGLQSSLAMVANGIKIHAWPQPWFFKGYFEYHIRDYHYLQLWCTFGNIINIEA
jgi:hypothetical protein